MATRPLDPPVHNPEADLPPQTLPPGWAELDAWLRSVCGYGADSMSGAAVRVILAHGLDAAKKALTGYLALAPRDGTDPFLFDHDAGAWAMSQFTSHPLGADYFAVPDNRPAKESKEAAFVLERMTRQGIDWTGSQAIADDPDILRRELKSRVALAENRVVNGTFPDVGDDLVRYGTLDGRIDLKRMSRDYLGRRASLQAWLDGQRSQSL